MARTRILVIEDDPAIRRGLVDAMKFAGHDVSSCDRGDTGLAQALRGAHDLVLLDVLLPGKDGFSLLAELRAARPQLPVILLTARGQEDDRVRGLELGADDYVVKPFSARELLARVEAVMRRSAERPSDVKVVRLNDRTIDLERREVALANGEVRRLSELEAGIVRYLAINQGRVIDRKELFQRVWGGNPHEVATRTVDMHISRLREKLEQDPKRPRWIQTVRARGYCLAEVTELS